MSSLTAERLYSLLPAVYRVRDEQQGKPLRALVSLIAQEFEAIEENIEQLYDDQFIETCAEWVAPYIGDLIGYRPLHGVAPKIASPRAEVANTIRFRRRKGTALMLEQLASDVTDWPARAVEFFEQLAITQYLKHLRPHARATADLRDTRAMFERGGAFNAVAHTAEMRRPESGTGRYNIPNIGIFLWRLRSLRLTAVPLVPDPGDASGRKFRVNPLGADLQLFRHAQTEDDISHLAEPINVPDPLRIRLMALQLRAAQNTRKVVASTDDWGAGHSVVIHDGTGLPFNINSPPPAPTPSDPDPLAVPIVRISDLRDILDAGGNVIAWAHESDVLAHEIRLDPERGRVLLGADRATEHAADAFSATLHYGSVREIGGGEYERTPAGDKHTTQPSVADGNALQPELNAIAGGGRLSIEDSLTYAQTPVFKVNDVFAPGAPGLEAVVAARNSKRPLIAVAGDATLAIGARGRLVLDGLVFSGGALRLAASADDEPRELVLRDCTLVPGLALNPDGTAVSPGAASLVVEHPFAKVTLERCITGSLMVAGDAEVSLTDCIVDAGAPESAAYAADNTGAAGAELTVTECTLIGKLHTKLLQLASNSIFFARLGTAPGETWKAPLIAERRQQGCVQFCYVPPGSVTPRRYRCVPDTAHPDVLPHFTSLRYGDPGYGQLRRATDKSIREGADDEGEMGVLHALFQPQRETNLLIRLDEYLRFGLHAGVFYAS